VLRQQSEEVGRLFGENSRQDGDGQNQRREDAGLGRWRSRVSEQYLISPLWGWLLTPLSDGTIVSGDSLGMVKFWDSQTCTQLQSFEAHDADVLCLVVGPVGYPVIFHFSW
jgi:U3 small nucleolar RNA-associated protein 4